MTPEREFCLRQEKAWSYLAKKTKDVLKKCDCLEQQSAWLRLAIVAGPNTLPNLKTFAEHS